jgi:DNA-binding response OmpR family regulator
VGIGLTFIGVSYALWKRKATPAPSTESREEQAIEKSTRLHFGESSMDVENQLLYSAHTQHNLTYREAKLLQLFIKHQNQVLDRDFILKSVWEDEGVTVGRSVDVFVSRLRKLLQEDTSLKIAAVHGVGYRLEVSNSNDA